MRSTVRTLVPSRFSWHHNNIQPYGLISVKKHLALSLNITMRLPVSRGLVSAKQQLGNYEANRSIVAEIAFKQAIGVEQWIIHSP
jgi:hypothetical protein